MKKSILVPLLLVLGIVTAVPETYAGPPYSVTVTNRSVTIVGRRGIQNAGQWIANTKYRQGAYVKNAGSIYMALRFEGTNVVDHKSGSTAPTHLHGEASDGGVIWRKNDRNRRRSTLVVLINSTPLYLTEGFSAVVSNGVPMVLQFTSFLYRGQDEIHAISEESSRITVQEFEDQ